MVVEYDGCDTVLVLGLTASSFMLLGALSSHVENPATLLERRLGRPTETERTRESPADGRHAHRWAVLDPVAGSGPQMTTAPDVVVSSKRPVELSPVNPQNHGRSSQRMLF